VPATGSLVRPLPYAAQLALIAVLYFVVARLSLALAIPPGYATAVWPPSGIALAAALLFGNRVWPGIWIGAALANVMVESSFLAAAIIATGNTLEAIVGAALIARHVGDPGRFERGEDVVKFIVLCAVSAAVGATIAALTLAIGHSLSWGEAWRGWWTWWQGDTTGMIIIAPLLLSWRAGSAAGWPAQKKAEAAAFALLLAATVAVIAADQGSAFAPFSLTFVALPFILWAAFRFGQREVTTAIAVACAVALWYAIERRELFATLPLNELLLMLLTFISMVVTTGLALVAVLYQRGRITDELRSRQLGLESQVQRYMESDPLTELPNFGTFAQRLALRLAAAGERGAAAMVAVVDIDRFKTVNDALGRRAGDELLRQMAARLSSHAAERIVARINGAQFAVATFDQPAIEARQSLARWFDAPFHVGGQDLRVAGRMGVALFPDHGTEPDALLMRAESALKKAKASGERCLLYDAPTMSERVAEKLLLENKLRRALERDEFVLYYQPKVDLETREIAGVEALIRWRSPELGVVPPSHFIALLEESGLILEVGSWALRRATRDQRSWRAAGLRVPRIAVNVSAIQLRQRDFVERVQAAIGEGAAQIDLEITESRIMEDVEATIAKLARLRELGIGIAIDDFGTGYSSLAYLTKLPVQILKIDRVFIVRMLEDEDAMALVQTILSLARTLELTVVAEGVETEMQADVLATLRCDQMQGYLFSKPLPPEEITALLGTKL
jgi:diguanylate cyclase (GGDEF)-like protein